MRATRYRLRFVTGVSLSAATYGSGTYGDGTYGQAATDPLPSFRIRPVPIPAGWPVDPAWVYRAGDGGPVFTAQILTDLGPLNLAPVAGATLVLTNHDGPVPITHVYPLTVQATPGEVRWNWNGAVVPGQGTYRVAIVLDYDSGRRLTVPYDDRTRMYVTAAHNGTPLP